MANSSLFTPFQKLLLIAVCLAALSWFFFRLHDLLLPFVLSLMLAYLLNPVVDRLEAWVKSRALSIAIIYIGFAALLVVASIFWLPSIINECLTLSKNIPNYFAQLKDYLVYIRAELEFDYPLLENLNIFPQTEAYAKGALLGFTQVLPKVIVSAISVLGFLSLVPFLLYFFLLQGPEIRKGLFKLVPNRYFEMTVNLFYHIGWKLGDYLRGVLIETGIVGVLTAVLLAFLGVDYAYLLGAIAGIVNIIPYVGPVLAAIPAIFVFYLKMKTMESVVYTALVFVGVQVIDHSILRPIIFAQSVGLHPLIVVVALVLGGGLAGIWGLVLAVPVAGAIKVITSQVSRQLELRKQFIHENLPSTL